MILKFYLIDDDINIIKIISKLIEDFDLGKVVGFNTNPEEALDEVLSLSPDICILDLLMPSIDGNKLMKNIKAESNSINFIMISQVSSEEIISESYECGAEFFIHKPINVIEVKNVISSVSEKISLKRTIDNIKGMLGNGSGQIRNDESRLRKNNIQRVLGEIGILGEKGTYDIIKIYEYIETVGKYDERTINEAFESINGKSKTIKQRMRRSMNKALTNIANAGIEDYMNDIFVKYSSTLFDFQSVKAEMDFLRGKRKEGGKVNIHRFMEGIILMLEGH